MAVEQVWWQTVDVTGMGRWDRGEAAPRVSAFCFSFFLGGLGGLGLCGLGC